MNGVSLFLLVLSLSLAARAEFNGPWRQGPDLVNDFPPPIRA
jgi:hypothetical protein